MNISPAASTRRAKGTTACTAGPARIISTPPAAPATSRHDTNQAGPARNAQAARPSAASTIAARSAARRPSRRPTAGAAAVPSR